MYYPYLRAKQFELKALREFSEKYPNEKKIVPILEPVKKQPNALKLAINDMGNNGMQFALIVNPADGDFKHESVSFEILLEELGLVENGTVVNNWIPAFLCPKNQLTTIFPLIEKYSFSNVMLIFRSFMDIEEPTVNKLVGDSRVGYIVNAFGTTPTRRLKKQLKDTGKKVIRLDDCFKSKTRNADYSLEDDEFFSEVLFYYTDEGFDGFADYTTLPSEYVEGGMLPYALAIHLSYQKKEDQIYVHHFVSDSNMANNDIRGKFREAASKVEPFFKDKEQTNAVKEIMSKADDSEGYPGLGYLKKLSVMNHLELMYGVI